MLQERNLKMKIDLSIFEEIKRELPEFSSMSLEDIVYTLAVGVMPAKSSRLSRWGYKSLYLEGAIDNDLWDDYAFNLDGFVYKVSLFFASSEMEYRKIDLDLICREKIN